MTEDTSESLLPPPPSYPGAANPFVSMALPGGGMVTLPMDMAPGSPSSQGTGTTITGGTGVLGASVGDMVPPLGTTGEPSTHFNLDQLLHIVQSFQLDTTHAHRDKTSNSKV